jgi:hypothetical protein
MTNAVQILMGEKKRRAVGCVNLGRQPAEIDHSEFVLKESVAGKHWIAVVSVQEIFMFC